MHNVKQTFSIPLSFTFLQSRVDSFFLWNGQTETECSVLIQPSIADECYIQIPFGTC